MSQRARAVHLIFLDLEQCCRRRSGTEVCSLVVLLAAFLSAMCSMHARVYSSVMYM